MRFNVSSINDLTIECYKDVKEAGRVNSVSDISKDLVGSDLLSCK
jgi:hypothetical protein